MSKRRKRFLLFALLAVCICVFLFFARVGGNIWRAVYPRTYRTYVEYYADKYGLEYAQVYAIIKTESGFKPNALSAVGARGLMQITEETFDWIKTKIAPGEPVTFDDLYDPEVNIRFGTYYLHYCMERYAGDLATASAAYHSGQGLVDRLLEDARYSDDGVTLHTFPYEQMNLYVHKVERNYKRYQELYT
ncbi:MAG: lytic transglycosylase domain-containing protein [Ruthenibacterium sp.]|jgi:soluble lytic murein transglycosylase